MNANVIEILAGGTFEKAVKEIGLASAVKTFQATSRDYQVWEMSDEDFGKLSRSGENWKDSWGWWRYSEGSNQGEATCRYVIKGCQILAWRKYQPREFGDLLKYFSCVLGASTERNVCALAVDLAKQNGMTLSQLFEKFVG